VCVFGFVAFGDGGGGGRGGFAPRFEVGGGEWGESGGGGFGAGTQPEGFQESEGAEAFEAPRFGVGWGGRHGRQWDFGERRGLVSRERGRREGVAEWFGWGRDGTAGEVDEYGCVAEGLKVGCVVLDRGCGSVGGGGSVDDVEEGARGCAGVRDGGAAAGQGRATGV
jgi:hypothetical protein